MRRRIDIAEADHRRRRRLEFRHAGHWHASFAPPIRRSNWTSLTAPPAISSRRSATGRPSICFFSADVEYPRKAGGRGHRGGEFGLHLRGGPHWWSGCPPRLALDPATALRDPFREAPGDRQSAARAVRHAPRRPHCTPWDSTRAWSRSSYSARTSRRPFSSWRAARPMPESWRCRWRWRLRCATAGATGRSRWTPIRGWSRAALF